MSVTRRMRRWKFLALTTALLLGATALAGCATPEEAEEPTPPGNGQPPPEDEAQWVAIFDVPSGATAAYLNLTVTRVDDGASGFEVRLLDPAGNEAGTINGTWDAVEQAHVQFALTTAADGDNATAEDGNATAELQEGRWTYEVWSDGRISVATTFEAVAPAEDGEAEA